MYVWWMKLWECRHASAVDAVSQSHARELITGSFIQSHWPCRTLCPISMFSRILARPSVLAPRTQGIRHRDAISSRRPSRASLRCRPIIDRMYFASRSPRLSLTCSWSSSNSRPIASICSGVRRWSGLVSSSMVTRPFVWWPLWVAVSMYSPWVVGYKSISTGPSGALMQVLMTSPSCP